MNQKKKLSLNKETVRFLDDQELKAVAGGTSFFGCGLTVPCSFWGTCACHVYYAKNENPIRIDDSLQRTLEDLGRQT